MKRKNTTSKMMKQYIAEALLLLLEKKPYIDITIHEITNKAGVNRSTYYRNFSSKENIVQFYYFNLLENYLYDVPKEIDLEEYLYKMFEHYLKYKKQLLLLYKNNLSYPLLNSLTTEFQNKKAEGTFEDKFRIYYHTGGIFNIFLLWFENDMEISSKELSTMSVAILPQGSKPMMLK